VRRGGIRGEETGNPRPKVPLLVAGPRPRQTFFACCLARQQLPSNRPSPLSASPPSHRRQAGVEVLDGDTEVGQPFDPELHEGVMRQPAPPGVPDGAVLSVLRAGYKVGDRLMRPALVVVAQE
jgi:hypothetical protein